MKTTNDYIKEMEASNILMSRECTFREYASEIAQFQDMICKMIAGNAYHESMRIDEARFIMESSASKKGLRNHPAVHNGVLAMKKLEKEIAITMSGAQGENIVFRTLEFLNRPQVRIFRNVYVTDGQDETELDAIVLTDAGVIILEIKKIKSDFTLTEDGRMVFAGGECYDDVPLGEKMALKRRLLKTRLEQAVAEKGLSIPVYVDSLIVFSTPKGQFIRIDDRYRREKHCFRTGLNKKIENYLGCVYYKADQMEQLEEIISEMESNVRRFATELDYDEIRRSIAEALAVLQDVPAVLETKAGTEEKSANKIQPTRSMSIGNKRLERKHRKGVGIDYVAASVLAGLLISGAAILNNMAIRRV